MADTLYLSLWYPNLRVAALPDKVVAVLSAFAAHGGEAGVYAATVWPVGWSESPIFQQVWGRSGPKAAKGADPRAAVEAALEILHDDYAYEFQIGWNLWELERGGELEERWVPVPLRQSHEGTEHAVRFHFPGAEDPAAFADPRDVDEHEQPERGEQRRRMHDSGSR